MFKGLIEDKITLKTKKSVTQKDNALYTKAKII